MVRRTTTAVDDHIQVLDRLQEARERAEAALHYSSELKAETEAALRWAIAALDEARAMLEHRSSLQGDDPALAWEHRLRGDDPVPVVQWPDQQ